MLLTRIVGGLNYRAIPLLLPQSFRIIMASNPSAPTQSQSRSQTQSTQQRSIDLIDNLINKVKSLSVTTLDRIKQTASTTSEAIKDTTSDLLHKPPHQSATTTTTNGNRPPYGLQQYTNIDALNRPCQGQIIQQPPFGSPEDEQWFPLIPPGHTSYSWYGSDDVNTPLLQAQQHNVNTLHNAELPNPSHQPHAKSVQSSTPAPAATTQSTATTPTPTSTVSPPDKKPSSGNKKKEKSLATASSTLSSDLHTDTPDLARIDIRVGKIIEAKKHPNADSLYIEMIDVGEEKPRQILSGLVKYIPLDEFIGSTCLVICNLKPGKLRGETSYGMVLAASNSDKSHVELIQPPESSNVGDRVTIDGLNVSKYTVDNQIDGKKENTAWSRVRGKLSTSHEMIALYDGKPLMVVGHGPLRAKSIANGTIS